MSYPRIVSTRLWLDDVRTPPSKDWLWVRSVAGACEVLRTGTVVEASLDNDLHPFEHDGLEVVEWMIEHQVYPQKVRVHTSNRPASTRMCGLLERSGYRAVPGRPRQFFRQDGTRMSVEEFARRSSAGTPATMRRLKRAEEVERAEIARRLGNLEPMRLWLDDDE